ncbi:uncharacterized protein LOC111396423 [Olea europaea var. sylvestris]|uniref:uncharacterized protein LOC111396423 n=1 Tax=Olea europaea var. sylvestris TaxID=158386 RepID=UPI000C1D5A63|nr:uncharacterized protein LOC111396423 [Olea europaea var. sylvestris]
MPSCFPITGKTTLAQNVIFDPSPRSMENPNRVLIVMNGLKDVSIELLEWVLKNFTFHDCGTITIFGVSPWLNIPLSAKTWSDIWSMDLEDLSIVKERIEWKNDPKYQKVLRLVDLCQKYGVVPEIRTEMGHPLRLLVVEQISSLNATLVVFDKYHDRKNIEYYAEKVPCNMVVVNDNGEVELIKKRSCMDSDVENTPTTIAESSDAAAMANCSTSIISGQLKKRLKPKSRGKREKEMKYPDTD